MCETIGVVNATISAGIKFISEANKGSLCGFIKCPYDCKHDVIFDCQMCPAQDDTEIDYSKEEAKEELIKRIKKMNKEHKEKVCRER